LRGGHSEVATITGLNYFKMFNQLISYDVSGHLIIWDLNSNNILFYLNRHSTTANMKGVQGLIFD
jgi:hypothetical protein